MVEVWVYTESRRFNFDFEDMETANGYVQNIIQNGIEEVINSETIWIKKITPPNKIEQIVIETNINNF